MKWHSFKLAMTNNWKRLSDHMSSISWLLSASNSRKCKHCLMALRGKAISWLDEAISRGLQKIVSGAWHSILWRVTAKARKTLRRVGAWPIRNGNDRHGGSHSTSLLLERLFHIDVQTCLRGPARSLPVHESVSSLSQSKRSQRFVTWAWNKSCYCSSSPVFSNWLIFRSYPLFLLLFFSFWVTTYFLLLALYSFRHLVHIVQILWHT